MSTKELIQAIEEIGHNPVWCLDDVIKCINTHMENATNQIKADGIREALNSVERTFTLQHKDASILGAPATVDYHALLKYARMLSTIGADNEQ